MNVNIYLNRDNVIEFGLLNKDSPVDANNVTRAILYFDPKDGGSTVEIDSDSVPGLFDFTQTAQFSGEITGILTLKLGAVAGVPVGKYKMDVVLYDAVNTNGINWGSVDARVFDESA